MLIINQNRNKTTKDLELNIYKKLDENFKVIGYQIENDNMILGIYKTEERAKEVLQEITNQYQHSKMWEHCLNERERLDIDNLLMQKSKDNRALFVYMMPKE